VKIYKLAHPIPYQDEWIQEISDKRKEEYSLEESQSFEDLFPNSKPLNKGASGFVYDIGNGQVAKITKNKEDLALAIDQMDNPKDFILNIHDVIDKGDYGIIVSEKINTLNSKEKSIYNDIRAGVRKLKRTGNFSSLYSAIYEVIKLGNEHYPIEQFERVGYAIRELSEKMELSSMSWYYGDMHSENIGWKGNKLVLLDLGKVK
jgi:hypothetical protein